MLNILTIDIEDYFQVHAFSDIIKFEDWDNFECRIERNTDRLLKILNGVTHKVQATFFILGWIAERYPSLVKRIQEESHEIACHGYAHKLIYTQSEEEFRQDIRKAKAILEDITGSEVIGYRAPSYSITNKSQWAFEILAEEGFKYDSSIFPIRHDFYGMPDAPRFPFAVSLNGNSNVEFSILNFESNTASLNNGNTAAPNISLTHSLINPSSDLSEPQHCSTAALNNSFTHSPNNSIPNHSKLIIQTSKLNVQNSQFIIEFPLSTVKVFGQNFPISGGGYFRLFPYSLIKKGLKCINQRENKPFIFYMHPWEIDPNQPRINGLSFRSKFRHYVNLDRTKIKFRKLLKDFKFSTIRQILIQNS
jgi:polysaccharide deacetylase family protein (PEP-CTERM system associated)